MSEEYKGRDPLEIAREAERDMNSAANKTGEDRSAGDSTLESGVDDSVTSKFAGAEVTYGSAASGAGDNREIPEAEGGGVDPTTGRPTKASDFEGPGGPEDKARLAAQTNPGDDDVRENAAQ